MVVYEEQRGWEMMDINHRTLETTRFPWQSTATFVADQKIIVALTDGRDGPGCTEGSIS